MGVVILTILVESTSSALQLYLHSLPHWAPELEGGLRRPQGPVVWREEGSNVSWVLPRAQRWPERYLTRP